MNPDQGNAPKPGWLDILGTYGLSAVSDNRVSPGSDMSMMLNRSTGAQQQWQNEGSLNSYNRSLASNTSISPGHSYPQNYDRSNLAATYLTNESHVSQAHHQDDRHPIRVTTYSDNFSKRESDRYLSGNNENFHDSNKNFSVGGINAINFKNEQDNKREIYSTAGSGPLDNICTSTSLYGSHRQQYPEIPRHQTQPGDNNYDKDASYRTSQSRFDAGSDDRFKNLVENKYDQKLDIYNRLEKSDDRTRSNIHVNETRDLHGHVPSGSSSDQRGFDSYNKLLQLSALDVTRIGNLIRRNEITLKDQGSVGSYITDDTRSEESYKRERGDARKHILGDKDHQTKQYNAFLHDIGSNPYKRADSPIEQVSSTERDRYDPYQYQERRKTDVQERDIRRDHVGIINPAQSTYPFHDRKMDSQVSPIPPNWNQDNSERQGQGIRQLPVSIESRLPSPVPFSKPVGPAEALALVGRPGVLHGQPLLTDQIRLAEIQAQQAALQSSGAISPPNVPLHPYWKYNLSNPPQHPENKGNFQSSRGQGRSQRGKGLPFGLRSKDKFVKEEQPGFTRLRIAPNSPTQLDQKELQREDVIAAVEEQNKAYSAKIGPFYWKHCELCGVNFNDKKNYDVHCGGLLHTRKVIAQRDVSSLKVNPSIDGPENLTGDYISLESKSSGSKLQERKIQNIGKDEQHFEDKKKTSSQLKNSDEKDQMLEKKLDPVITSEKLGLATTSSFKSNVDEAKKVHVTSLAHTLGITSSLPSTSASKTDTVAEEEDWETMDTDPPKVVTQTKKTCKICRIAVFNSQSHLEKHWKVHIGGRSHRNRYLLQLSTLGPDKFFQKYDNSAQFGDITDYDAKDDKICSTKCFHLENWRQHIISYEHYEKTSLKGKSIGAKNYRSSYFDVPSSFQEQLWPNSNESSIFDKTPPVKVEKVKEENESPEKQRTSTTTTVTVSAPKKPTQTNIVAQSIPVLSGNSRSNIQNFPTVNSTRDTKPIPVLGPTATKPTEAMPVFARQGFLPGPRAMPLPMSSLPQQLLPQPHSAPLQFPPGIPPPPLQSILGPMAMAPQMLTPFGPGAAAVLQHQIMIAADQQIRAMGQPLLKAGPDVSRPPPPLYNINPPPLDINPLSSLSSELKPISPDGSLDGEPKREISHRTESVKSLQRHSQPRESEGWRPLSPQPRSRRISPKNDRRERRQSWSPDRTRSPCSPRRRIHSPESPRRSTSKSPIRSRHNRRRDKRSSSYHSQRSRSPNWHKRHDSPHSRHWEDRKRSRSRSRSHSRQQNRKTGSRLSTPRKEEHRSKPLERYDSRSENSRSHRSRSYSREDVERKRNYDVLHRSDERSGHDVHNKGIEDLREVIRRKEPREAARSNVHDERYADLRVQITNRGMDDGENERAVYKDKERDREMLHRRTEEKEMKLHGRERSERRTIERTHEHWDEKRRNQQMEERRDEREVIHRETEERPSHEHNKDIDERIYNDHDERKRAAWHEEAQSDDHYTRESKMAWHEDEMKKYHSYQNDLDHEERRSVDERDKHQRHRHGREEFDNLSETNSNRRHGSRNREDSHYKDEYRQRGLEDIPSDDFVERRTEKYREDSRGNQYSREPPEYHKERDRREDERMYNRSRGPWSESERKIKEHRRDDRNPHRRHGHDRHDRRREHSHDPRHSRSMEKDTNEVEDDSPAPDPAMVDRMQDMTGISDRRLVTRLLQLLSKLEKDMVNVLGKLNPAIVRILVGDELSALKLLKGMNPRVVEVLGMMEPEVLAQLQEDHGLEFLLTTLENLSRCEQGILDQLGTLVPTLMDEYDNPQDLIHALLREHSKDEGPADIPKYQPHGGFRGGRGAWRGRGRGKTAKWRGPGRGRFTGQGHRGRGTWRGKRSGPWKDDKHFDHQEPPEQRRRM